MKDKLEGVDFNTSRVRLTQTFQHRPYQSMSLDCTIECTNHDAEPDEVIAEGVKVIQAGFGLALWQILKRYNENKSDKQLMAELNTIIPPALKVTLLDNEFIMDALLLEAKRRLEETK